MVPSRHCSRDYLSGGFARFAATGTSPVWPPVTHDLIEKMVGHRIRLVQQAPEQWHEGEEERLSAYARRGRDLDRRLSALLAFAPRGWMVVALGALGVEIARDASAASVAIGAGGILLALSALSRLVNGVGPARRCRRRLVAVAPSSRPAPGRDERWRPAGSRPVPARRACAHR